MKNRDYTDLRNKTIFDFCTDKKVLEDIAIFADKEEYLKLSESCKGVRWKNMLIFAEYSGNKELEDAVRKEFAEEIRALFNE